MKDLVRGFEDREGVAGSALFQEDEAFEQVGKGAGHIAQGVHPGLSEELACPPRVAPVPEDMAGQTDEHRGVVGSELDRLLELGDRLVAAPGKLVDLGEHRPIEPAGHGLPVTERLDQSEGLLKPVHAGQGLCLA